MNISELIGKFLEKTNYHQHKDVALIIAYGSRITSTYRDDSDLDILIITSKNGTYRQVLIIDGVPIDVTIMSYEEAEINIICSNIKGSTYFDTVLKYGLVVLDKIDIYGHLRELLNYKVKGERSIDGELYDRVEYHIYQFLNEKRNKDIHYFASLELMRKLYHAKCNCSNIQTSKVYDLYTNKKLATEKYMLKLPDDKFMHDYLIALQETDEKKQKEWLMRFFKELENISIHYKEKEYFLSTSQIKMKLINLNNAILKCENMLQRDYPSSKSLFYVIVEEIYYLYRLIHKTELQADINFSCTDIEQMIQTLKTLFSFVDTEYSIDYNDYKFKLY